MRPFCLACIINPGSAVCRLNSSGRLKLANSWQSLCVSRTSPQGYRERILHAMLCLTPQLSVGRERLDCFTAARIEAVPAVLSSSLREHQDIYDALVLHRQAELMTFTKHSMLLRAGDMRAFADAVISPSPTNSPESKGPI